MIRVLIQHYGHVFSQLPGNNKFAKRKDRREQSLDLLPEKFNRQDILDMIKSLSIEERSADRTIVIFCQKELVFKEKQDR